MKAILVRLLASCSLIVAGTVLVAGPAKADVIWGGTTPDAALETSLRFPTVVPVYPTVTQPTRVCDFSGDEPKSVLVPGKIEWGNVEHGLWSFFSRGVNPNIGGNIPGLEPGIYTLHFEAVQGYVTPDLEDWLLYNPEPADIEVSKDIDPEEWPPFWTFTITMFEPAALECTKETVTATATATETTSVATLPVTSPPQPLGIAAVAVLTMGAGAGFILWGRRRRDSAA